MRQRDRGQAKCLRPRPMPRLALRPLWPRGLNITEQPSYTGGPAQPAVLAAATICPYWTYERPVHRSLTGDAYWAPAVRIDRFFQGRRRQSARHVEFAAIKLKTKLKQWCCRYSYRRGRSSVVALVIFRPNLMITVLLPIVGVNCSRHLAVRDYPGQNPGMFAASFCEWQCLSGRKQAGKSAARWWLCKHTQSSHCGRPEWVSFSRKCLWASQQGAPVRDVRRHVILFRPIAADERHL